MQKMLGMNGPRTKGNTMAITLPPTIMEVETSVKNDKFPLDQGNFFTSMIIGERVGIVIYR